MILNNNTITNTPQALEAVKKDSFAIQKVPKQFWTLEVLLAAVEHSGSALRYIDPSYHTHEICLAAVQNYGRALKYVKSELQTPEICMAAIKQSIFALKYVEDNNLKILLAGWYENNKNIIKITEDESDSVTYIKTKDGIKEYITNLFKIAEEVESVDELDDKDTGFYFIRLDNGSYDVYKVIVERQVTGWFWTYEVVDRDIQREYHLEQIEINKIN